MNKREFLIENFIKYTKITSQSDPIGTNLPTTEGQMELARVLKKDLEEFGVKEIELQDNAILIAKIPANTSAPSVSFMSHLDTVDIGISPHVNARVISFTGEDFFLNEEKNILFKVSDYPSILQYKGEEVIVTDGTSVLGADDKAGVTAIMGLAYYLMNNDIAHGDVYLVFVPDEEIGLCGAKALDISKIPVEFSYTVDSGFLGSFNYETFNAAEASIHIQGVSIHPGRAKNVLLNPINIMHDFLSHFDPMDTPEHTEKYEGYFYPITLSANPTEAHILFNIRDFDDQKFKERKEFVQNVIKKLQEKYPRAVITMTMKDIYANIGNFLAQDRRAIDVVEKAMKNIGVEIQRLPLRGGTDGSVLSSKGLMTPNLFTGSYNVHSSFEYLPVNPFIKSLENLIEITRLIAEDYKK